MSDAVGSIIEQAMMSVGVRNTSDMKMQKFTISETTFEQLEAIKLKSRVQFKELVQILVEAAYAAGEVSANPEEDTRTRRWYVMMTLDARRKLDELCDTAGGISAGFMLGNIVQCVCSNLDGFNPQQDFSEFISQMDWEVA